MPRLFVAVHPSPEYAAELLAQLAELEIPGQRPRPTPIAQVHCTLLFLGDRGERALPGTLASCQAACVGLEPFRLRPVRLLALPMRGPKRTIAFECDRPAGLLELRRRLVARLARETQRESKRGFLPHITIARWSGKGADMRLDGPVSMSDFVVEEVRLMASVLRPSWAEHRLISSFGLGRD